MTKHETTPTSGSGVTCARLHTEMTEDEPTSNRRIWVQRSIVVLIWVIAAVAWRRYQTGDDLGAAGAAQRFIDSVEGAWWGIAAFIGVYLLRPIVLFPASVLTVVGGVLFGPAVGIIVVVLAANTSALIAYAIGRTLGRPPGDSGALDTSASTSFTARWADRMRSNSFETVFVMRLLFLPYDLVNYMSGVLRIRWAPFLLATALGSIPGTISFVLLGSSLDRVDQGLDGLDPLVLVFGVAIFIVSIALARTLRHRADPAGLEIS